MKKKILFLIPTLEIGGGAERIAATLSIKLSEIYQIFIVTFYNVKNIYLFKGKYISLNENLKIPKKILRIFKLYKLFKFISPDIIISFMDHTNIIAILLKFFFRIKIPLIITVHTNPLKQYSKEAKYLNFLIKLLYRLNLVDKIITICKEIQSILEKDYRIQKEKIKTIFNGIELKEIIENAKEELTDYKQIFDNENLIKFITVGRLVKLKGHKYLIEAFYKVKKHVPNSILFLIGEGPLKNELETQIKKMGLKEDIKLLGLKKNPFKFMVRSNIFVLSSKREGFPTVLLEALACGLPIIATNCHTGPKEILDNGNYGFLVNVMDSQDMAEKMRFLANNLLLMEQYSKKSSQRARFFDLEVIKKEWIDLIENYIK